MFYIYSKIITAVLLTLPAGVTVGQNYFIKTSELYTFQCHILKYLT